VLFIVGIQTVRSAWFADYVRRRVISVAEESTGGRAELASFSFDWTHLRARVTGFVLHGKEPAGEAPLLRVETIQLRLKLVSAWKREIDLAYLGVERPTANIIVFADGTTNVPQPRIPSNKPALETVVD